VKNATDSTLRQEKKEETSAPVVTESPVVVKIFLSVTEKKQLDYT
jgi:hypothetical protein